VHRTTAIAAVTVQHSPRGPGFPELALGAVAEQIHSVATDTGVQATKTGMPASASVIHAAAEAFERFQTVPIVVDPVAVSKHGDPLRDGAVEALRSRLLPAATLVTPNLDAVRVPTGTTVRARADMDAAARALHALGARWVLVKGGHRGGSHPTSSPNDLLDHASIWLNDGLTTDRSVQVR
jgi:hydroxymethylpyrimidine/phosphomethylpyrimidine kinase